ncbi:MAG: heme biosynthesis HemY N-terminal domain-containing protein [Gammaproteobacteria bacterium]
MRNFFYFLGLILAAVATAFYVHYWLSRYQDPGYVLIGIGHWSLETSLVVFAMLLVIGFFIFYTFFRALGWLIRLPGKLKKRGRDIKFNRSQEALIAGLVDSAEGNWEKAEKVLIKHASNSGAPLIHYLTAARAAHSRGACEKRDEYLRIAADTAPGSALAIGLTQAELHLSEKQFDQALEALTQLRSIDPEHAGVLKLMHQTYQSLGDWESMRLLLPSLYKNKVMMEAEVRLLEAETFSTLLKQAAQKGDSQAAEELWRTMPEHVQTMPGMRAVYFAVMLELGEGAKIESQLYNALGVDWNPTLLVLYGSIPSGDPGKQLLNAEAWLNIHPHDAVLLSVLGKICVKDGQIEKAEQYLTQSLEIEPIVGTYQLLGDLLFEHGDKDRACECYKRGLELASNEVVEHVEEINS